MAPVKSHSMSQIGSEIIRKEKLGKNMEMGINEANSNILMNFCYKFA